MSITIDERELSISEVAGMSTVGHVLQHASARNRLVVRLSIDGEEPRYDQLEQLRAQPLAGKAVFVETIEPVALADEICSNVNTLLDEADQMRLGAIEHLGAGEHAEALKKLGACFNAWMHSQESVSKLGRLLRLDLDRITLGDADNTTLANWLNGFARQLADIRTALEGRDFVALSDILAYEADRAGEMWKASIRALRETMK
jgi:hypothetical protein